MKIKHIVIEGSEEDITVRATTDGATASVVRMSWTWYGQPVDTRYCSTISASSAWV